MAADRQRVDSIVASALSLDPAARAVWLDQACGDDAALRAWVEALIRAREQPALDRGATPAKASTTHGGNGECHAAEIAERLSAGDAAASLIRSLLAPSTVPGSLGRLGGYEALEILGQGSIGIVLRALDEKQQRVVAIKVLSPALAANVTTRRRFLDEARAAAPVCHENVVAIYAVHEQPIPYLVMEYVAGPSLQEKLAATGPLELKQVLRIGQQIAAGLAAAHRQGVLHRAIKPGNILLGYGVARVKITDFGLSAALNDAGPRQGGLASGAPTYMAPEQALGDEVDGRADLFSLGTLLYTLCTGRLPFGESGSLAILKHIVEDQPRDIRELNRDIPPWLCEIIARLHAKMPAERYQSAAEVAEMLVERLAALQLRGEVAQGAAERPTAAAPRASPRRLQRALVAAMGFVLFIVSDLLISYYYGLPPFARDNGRHEPGASDVQPRGEAPTFNAPEEAFLDIQVQGRGLRFTVRRVGPEPFTYVQEAEGKPQSLAVQPGRIWVHATRAGETVFEKFIEVAAGERKSVLIGPADELPPARAPQG
jgi:hypothetical protein